MRISKRALAAAALATSSLAGCVVVPLDSEGRPLYVPVQPGSPAPQAGAPQSPAAPPPALLQARLYPANDIAAQTGMLSGTVTNLMSGKGRFQLSYRGELLTGEATRVAGDERKGVASAYAPSGSFMSCEYQMRTPYQGAGICTFSNGARYQVHLDNY